MDVRSQKCCEVEQVDVIIHGCDYPHFPPAVTIGAGGNAPPKIPSMRITIQASRYGSSLLEIRMIIISILCKLSLLYYISMVNFNTAAVTTPTSIQRLDCNIYRPPRSRSVFKILRPLRPCPTQVSLSLSLDFSLSLSHMELHVKRWEGTVSTRLTRASADQIWSLLSDFCNIAKWFPGLTTSYCVSGEIGQVGLIRYNAGTSFQPPGGGEASVGWSYERLAAIDRTKRTFTYELLDNNIGFNSYAATFKVIPVADGGCVIEWSWATDPVEGWSLDEMASEYDTWLQMMAERMEHALVGTIGRNVGFM